MEIINNGKTVFLKSKILNCPHGFSTRKGGVSTAPLVDGLNLTITQREGEIRENVIENLEIFADAVGVKKETILSVPECNGNEVAYVTQEDAGKGYYNNVGLNYFLNGNKCYDGYYTDTTGITIGMKTADCLPILFSGEKDGITEIVGGAHIGCKDSIDNPMCNIASIAIEVLTKMKQKSGLNEKDFKVALGPAAQKCCCRVSDTIIDILLSNSPTNIIKKHIKKEKDNLWYIDMYGINIDILLEAGIPTKNIDYTQVCTVCSDQSMFFSRIRDGVKTGSMLSVISLPS